MFSGINSKFDRIVWFALKRRTTVKYSLCIAVVVLNFSKTINSKECGNQHSPLSHTHDWLKKETLFRCRKTKKNTETTATLVFKGLIHAGNCYGLMSLLCSVYVFPFDLHGTHTHTHIRTRTLSTNRMNLCHMSDMQELAKHTAPSW